MSAVFELIVAQVHVALAEPGLPYGVYRLAQQEHGQQRRVLWIPTQFATASLVTTNPLINADGVRSTAMHLEKWEVECHIVGSSMQDAEDIRQRILYAVRQTMPRTSSRPTGGVWVTQAQDEAAVMHGGAQKVIQRFEWDVHALEPLPTQVVITAVETKGQTLAAEDGAGAVLETEGTFVILPPP